MISDEKYRQACRDQYIKDQELDARFVQACFHLEKEHLYEARGHITYLIDKISQSQQITLVNLLQKQIAGADRRNYYCRPDSVDLLNFIALMQKLHEKKVEGADSWLSPGKKNYNTLLGWIDSEPAALYELGQMHCNGSFGVPQNNSEALKCYLKAYAQNHDAARANAIGLLYGNQNDARNALLYYKKASDGRNQYGSYNLAIQYHFAKGGVAKDLEQAERYYKRSIENTSYNSIYSKAHYQLARVYKERDSIKSTSYRWENFLELSKKNHKIAADAGHTLAAFELAVLYQSEKKISEAEEYFKKAADKGNTESQWRLSELYSEAGKQDKAGSYLKKAALAGNSNANYQLGCQYEAKKAYQDAFECFYKALNDNHTAAKKKIEDQGNHVASYYSLYKILKEKDGTFEVTCNTMVPYLMLQNTLNYFFKDAQYLVSAFTRTIPSESKEAPFQALEFLGDSILTTIIREYCIDKKPKDWTVGDMNQAMQSLVSNRGALLTLAQELKLSELIILDKHESKPVTEKMQSDAMEALLGAIFQDYRLSSMSDKKEYYTKVSSVVRTLWKPHLEKALQASPSVENKLRQSTPIVTVSPRVAASSKVMTAPSRAIAVSVQESRLTQYNPALFETVKAPLSEYKVALEKKGGANGKRRGKQGDTPLLSLVRGEKNKVAKNAFKGKVTDRIDLLLKAGATWSATNNKGESAKSVLLQFPDAVRNKIPASMRP